MAAQQESRIAQFRRLYEQGMDLLTQGKDEEAMGVLYRAARTAPEGWLCLAQELVKDNEHEQALERLREVLHLTNDPALRGNAMNSIGMILAGRGQMDQARDCFDEVVRLCPGVADGYSNQGLLRQWEGEYESAVRLTTRALTIDPWHEQAQFTRAMSLLTDGQYQRGFQEYECRWRSRGNGISKIAASAMEWDGTSGNRVFVYGEQGAGDSILMLRYARLIRERGMHQIWTVQKQITPLARTVPEIDEVIEPGQPLPEFDCHIPAMSLPRIFGTTLATVPPAPYLQRPDPVDYGPGFHVGICWRGSKSQNNDTYRSTNLREWLPVLGTEGVTFHSLQFDHADEGLLYPQLTQHEQPTDWLDTARRVCGLDLVISVDTGLVHLCGAMDAPVWCALHARPYFVFPPRCGDATPWYRSVKLYRQEKILTWQPVMRRIAEDLWKQK